jgi:hypothetical protein
MLCGPSRRRAEILFQLVSFISGGCKMLTCTPYCPEAKRRGRCKHCNVLAVWSKTG